MFDDADDATVMVPTFGPGTFFADRYRIDSLLGSGAMGRVYAATELHSERRVALKILHKERLGEADTVERFRREAEVLASIGHPCIVEIYTFHRTQDGTPYLAMELLEGVTLKTRLANAGRFQDPRDFQEVLDCICGALASAHARGVVHRDMKPDNVFLPAVGEPRAKLVDFGLSRIGAVKKGITHSGMILGTPRYMAPEQIRDAASAGPSVDIYSVGILVFESLTGQSPYPAQDYGQLLGCVLENRTTPFEQLRPDLPRAIGDVVRRAMVPEPAARFQSCDEVADAYAHAIGSPSRRHQIGARPTPSQRPPRRIASNQNIVASKGSTLAFDASALEGLPDPFELAPMLASYDGVSMPAPQATPFSSGGDTAPLGVGYTPPQAAPKTGGDTLFIPGLAQSSPPGAAPGPQPHMPPPGALAPAPLPSFPGVGQSPAAGGYASHAGYAPQPSPAPQASMSGAGYTSVMGAPSPYAPSAAGYGSVMGAPSPQAQAPRAPTPPATFTTPPKRKSRGLLLFLVAMVVVIVLSAAGGFVLRAYMRGELGAAVPALVR
jgi:serine/threonine protein kinase